MWNISKEGHNIEPKWWLHHSQPFLSGDVAKGSSEFFILEGYYPRAKDLQSVCFRTLVSEWECSFPCYGIHDCVCRNVLYFLLLNKWNPEEPCLLINDVWMFMNAWMNEQFLLVSMEIRHRVQNMGLLWRGMRFNNDFFSNQGSHFAWYMAFEILGVRHCP